MRAPETAPATSSPLSVRDPASCIDHPRVVVNGCDFPTGELGSQKMAIQVYSSTQPAARNRALVVTLGLLLLCTGAAFTMSQQRTSQGGGPLIGGAEFGARFRAPGLSEAPQFLVGGEGIGFRFLMKTENGGEAVLRVRRITVDPDVSPQDVCVHVLRADANPRSTARESTLEGVIARIGNANGIEVRDLNTSTIVRSVVLPGGVAYIASLAVIGSSVDKTLYRQFDRMCKSFEFVSR